MNTHLPAIPHVQPATPLHNGRRQHELPYTPAPPPMTPSHPYHGYQQPHPHAHPMPPHFHQQHPQQWYQYPNMPPPMPRPYSQYPPMVAPPYPTPQGVAPMPYRPYPPPHAPSSSSIRSQQDMLSPSSSSTSLHVPTSAPPLAQSPRQPPPAPPPPTPAAPAPPTIRLPFYPPVSKSSRSRDVVECIVKLPCSFRGSQFPMRRSLRKACGGGEENLLHSLRTSLWSYHLGRRHLRMLMSLWKSHRQVQMTHSRRRRKGTRTWQQFQRTKLSQGCLRLRLLIWRLP